MKDIYIYIYKYIYIYIYITLMNCVAARYPHTACCIRYFMIATFYFCESIFSYLISYLNFSAPFHLPYYQPSNRFRYLTGNIKKWLAWQPKAFSQLTVKVMTIHHLNTRQGIKGKNSRIKRPKKELKNIASQLIFQFSVATCNRYIILQYTRFIFTDLVHLKLISK